MKNSTTLFSIVLLATSFLFFSTQCNSSPQENLPTNLNDPLTQDSIENPDSINQVELVFCLDATGSMGGLIQTAKDKIWDIVLNLSQTKKKTNIKLGMIFYRDRQDDFVTKQYQLTTDIDNIYSELLSIGAAGGGDSPESVNQSLFEAVSQMKWSENKKVYKTIFLVGDCPPHMDYENEVQYPESCKMATKNGIVINTFKLGSGCRSAVQHFKNIAASTNGVYKALDQHAKDIVISTPYDDSINYYSYKIDESKIYYGSEKEKMRMKSRKDKTMKLYDNASAEANSTRSSYNNSKSGKSNWFGNKELVQEIIENKISLDSLSKAQLPDELKNLSAEERKTHVDELIIKRKAYMKSMQKLVKHKAKFIKEKNETTDKTSTFSYEIKEIMKEQAQTKGVTIE